MCVIEKYNYNWSKSGWHIELIKVKPERKGIGTKYLLIVIFRYELLRLKVRYFLKILKTSLVLSP